MTQAISSMVISDMNKRLEHVIKAIAFTACVIVLMAATFNVLWLSENNHFRPTMKKFYSLPEDSADVILLGPSSVREYYIPPLAYDAEGVASYSLSCGMQSFDATSFLISEAEKTQSPAVYVVDIRALSDIQSYYYSEVSIRRVADAMRLLSPERIGFINHMYDRWSDKADFDSSRWEFYFGASIYHNRWEDINKEDFGIEDGSWMGYSIEEQNEVFDHGQWAQNLTSKRGEIPAYASRILAEFMDYCRKNNVNVLFINMPGVYEEKYNAAVNSLGDVIRSEGFEFLDLNQCLDEIGIDLQTDMKNSDHVNTRGAEKLTRYLAARLKEKYGLPDRRTGDTSDYGIWADEYEKYSNAVQKVINH